MRRRKRAGAVRDGAHGVVVTQGTDTMEETAFLVDCLWDDDAPFVFTGAMRNPTLPGADGPANLTAAIRTAAVDAARGRGAMVVFNDEIHAARFVRKTHSTSPAAFRSPDAGPIGHVVEGVPRFLTDVSRRSPRVRSWRSGPARRHPDRALHRDARRRRRPARPGRRDASGPGRRRVRRRSRAGGARPGARDAGRGDSGRAHLAHRRRFGADRRPTRASARSATCSSGA